VDTEGDPVPGWEVYVDGQTAVTGADGCVNFILTRPGPYTITEESRSDWTPVGPTFFDFTTESGGSYGPYTFTNFQHVNVVLDPSTKTDSLFIDADSNGLVNPGDTLLYEVTIWNEGAIDATGVVFTDTPDSHTTLVEGSVSTSKGTVIEGNTAGDSSVGVAIGTVLGGGPATETVTISFQVTINDPLPPGLYQVCNQGTIDSNEAPPVITDDPDTSASNDPTCTPLGRPPIHHIPTTSEWGMIAMGILFATALVWSVRKKWVTSTDKI